MSIVRTAELRCAIGRSRRPQRSFLVKECRSTRLPLLVLHICAGILGLLSGAVDVVAQGFPSASSGNVFVISMLSLAASALYPALMKSQVTNVLGGVLTFYLVTTATVGDVRMLVRGGVSGAQRIARHLWCMCFALFFRHRLLFLGQQQVFPRFALFWCSVRSCSVWPAKLALSTTQKVVLRNSHAAGPSA